MSANGTSRILVVDDDPLGRDTLAALLAPEGYELLLAESGPAALDKATTTTPDLVLLDIMMPGMDGFEVCKRFRQDARMSEVPIILITALDDRDSKLRGIDAGADDFVSKPFDKVELRIRLRTIVRLNRFRKLLRERELREEAERSLRQSERELRILSAKLLDAQETERQRIARELHDSVGQSLSALKISVEALSQAEGDTPQVNQATAMIQDILEEVRRISMDLRPSILDDLGIVATIRWLCRQFQQLHPQQQIESNLKVDEEQVPDRLKTVVYRILQEALNNAARHSGAKLVVVSLEKEANGLHLTVQDDGGGFSPPEIYQQEDSQRGLGLASMRERTQLSGGRFKLRSAPHEGTVVAVGWPSE